MCRRRRTGSEMPQTAALRRRNRASLPSRRLLAGPTRTARSSRGGSTTTCRPPFKPSTSGPAEPSPGCGTDLRTGHEEHRLTVRSVDREAVVDALGSAGSLADALRSHAVSMAAPGWRDATPPLDCSVDLAILEPLEFVPALLALGRDVFCSTKKLSGDATRWQPVRRRSAWWLACRGPRRAGRSCGSGCRTSRPGRRGGFPGAGHQGMRAATGRARGAESDRRRGAHPGRNGASMAAEADTMSQSQMPL